MANNYVILIAPARRTGAAHSKVGDGTARVSDMKERERVLRSIVNRCLAFPPCISIGNFVHFARTPGWNLIEIMFQPPGIEPGTI
jgi:hypothetical protein